MFLTSPPAVTHYQLSPETDSSGAPPCKDALIAANYIKSLADPSRRRLPCAYERQQVAAFDVHIFGGCGERGKL